MEFIDMSYKGFSFPVNPASIKTQMKKRTVKKDVMSFASKVKETGFEPAVISGSGSFSGDKAQESAHELMRIFKEEGSAYLFSPEFFPLKAFFTELQLKADASKRCIEYSFKFVEDSVNKKSRFDFRFTYAFEGENLFDISNRTGVPVEKLFKLNDYEDLFSVSQGDKVWLK